MHIETLIATLHVGATLFMTGLIWFVQIVHYPLFGRVGPSAFPEYEARHQTLTTRIVAPVMLVELSTAIALVFVVSESPARPLAIFGLGLIAIIWFSTACVQVPCHRRLANALDDTTLSRLVRTNWVRTISWSVRSGIALVILAVGTGA